MGVEGGKCQKKTEHLFLSSVGSSRMYSADFPATARHPQYRGGEGWEEMEAINS